jgi:hypothetical protein
MKRLKGVITSVLESDNDETIREIHSQINPITHIPREDLGLYEEWFGDMDKYYENYGGNLMNKVPKPLFRWEK